MSKLRLKSARVFHHDVCFCPSFCSQSSVLICVGVVGMAADPLAAARIKRTGLGIISPSIGLQAMSALLSQSHSAHELSLSSLFSAVPVDWEKILGSSEAQAPFFLQDFAPEKQHFPALRAKAGTSQHQRRLKTRKTVARPLQVAANIHVMTSSSLVLNLHTQVHILMILT